LLSNKLQIAKVHRKGKFGEMQLAGSGGVCESPAVVINFLGSVIVLDFVILPYLGQ
jgi:hypothetical protein